MILIKRRQDMEMKKHVAGNLATVQVGIRVTYQESVLLLLRKNHNNSGVDSVIHYGTINRDTH